MATELKNSQQDVDQLSPSMQAESAQNTHGAADKHGSSGTIDRILGVKVPVIVRVAEKKMTMEDVLKLSLGSIITFDKDAYQHIDLMINNSVIGLGQPIKKSENFGLRITQIGEITDTIKSLGKTQT